MPDDEQHGDAGGNHIEAAIYRERGTLARDFHRHQGTCRTMSNGNRQSIPQATQSLDGNHDKFRTESPHTQHRASAKPGRWLNPPAPLKPLPDQRRDSPHPPLQRIRCLDIEGAIDLHCHTVLSCHSIFCRDPTFDRSLQHLETVNKQLFCGITAINVYLMFLT